MKVLRLNDSASICSAILPYSAYETRKEFSRALGLVRRRFASLSNTSSALSSIQNDLGFDRGGKTLRLMISPSNEYLIVTWVEVPSYRGALLIVHANHSAQRFTHALCVVTS